MLDTPLQQRIWDAHRGVLEEEETRGAEVIEALVEFYQHPPLVRVFTRVREYLDYRRKDVAITFSLACLKFSLGSDVALNDPRLQDLLRLVGDHVSIANNIVSYDKEYRYFKDGRVRHLVNIVVVVQDTCGWTSSDDAKAISYALQLETEQNIVEELERLKEI